MSCIRITLIANLRPLILARMLSRTAATCKGCECMPSLSSVRVP